MGYKKGRNYTNFGTSCAVAVVISATSYTGKFFKVDDGSLIEVD